MTTKPIALEMPGLPQVGGKPVASVIGGDDARQQAFAHFQHMWNRAGKPAPKLGSDPEAFDRAEAEYRANPLLSYRQAFEAEYRANVVASPENATKMYQYRVQKLANDYMAGIDLGAQDPKINADRQTAIQELFNGNILSAIKLALMSVGAVGDFMAAVGKKVMSHFNGAPISFVQAQEDIKLEKAYGGAAAAIKADAAIMINEGKSHMQASPATAMTTTNPADAVQVAFKQAAGMPKPETPVIADNFDAPAGSPVPKQSTGALPVSSSGLSNA